MEKYRGMLVENFLSSEENSVILDFAKTTDSWERSEPGSFWDNRVVNAQNIYRNHNKEVGLLMLQIRNRAAEKIKEQYGLLEVYPDVMVLARWFPGQEQPPHADDMRNVDGHEAFHHREFGSIIYLNEDYSGGHTFYPDHSIEVTPKAGMLAVHPASTDHFHGVTKVEGGMRYTIASFWTTQKQFNDQWELY
jgi:hypothetical protein